MSTIPFDILTPKARKDYRCIYCGEEIPKGEVHSKASGAWEGELQNWRMHNECYERHSEESDDGGFYPFENERPARNNQ